MSEAIFVSEKDDEQVHGGIANDGYVRKDMPTGSIAISEVNWYMMRRGEIPYGVPHDEVSNGFRLHRDPIRGGWWVAPEGVRYAAVEGVPVGQKRWSSPDEEDATDYARRFETGSMGVHRMYRQTGRSWDGWAVIDLHDLGPEVKPCDPPPKRFQLVPCREVPAGRKHRHVGGRGYAEESAEACRTVGYLGGGALRMPDGGICDSAASKTPSGCWSIVDTLDGWVEKRKDYTFKTAEDAKVIESYRIVDIRRNGPTDAEIVKTWELVQRHDVRSSGAPWPCGTEWDAPTAPGKQGRLAAIFVGPKATAVRVTVVECRAAWSRELRRRVKDAEEKRKLPCQGDYPEEHEGR